MGQLRTRVIQTARQTIFFMLIAGCLTAASAGEKDKKRQPKEGATTQEMVLDDILIEGKLDRPNVTILPTRERLDLPEVGFVERSFELEMKALPEKDLFFKKDFDKVTKVDDFKKLLQQITRSATKPTGKNRKRK